MRTKLLSLVVWYAVCALVIFTFLPMLLLNQQSRLNPDRAPFANLVRNWEVYFGAEVPVEGGWKPFDEQARAEMTGYKGTIWLQRDLPELKWRDPYLFFSMMSRFEVYLDGELLYQFNMDHSHRYLNPDRLLHPVPINPEDSGKMLLLRMEWNGSSLFGYDMALIGEPEQLLFGVIHSGLSFIIYSLVSITFGIGGLVLFIHRREAVYGWFALFCCTTGAMLLLVPRSLQWFINMNQLYYWQALLPPVIIWAYVGFFASALGIRHRRFMKIMHSLLLVYFCVTALTAVLLPEQFLVLNGMASIVAALAAFVIVTYSLIQLQFDKRPHNDPGSSEFRIRKWIVRGYFTLSLCEGVNFAAFANAALITELLTSWPYLYRIVEGLLPNGLLLFMICMVMVVVSHVRRVHLAAERSAAELLVKNKELEQFHRNLEQLVETRTAELEQANRSLALSLREKAETLAEMSVLEERNRIAYEMHDVVGHTLTAAIVQTEATKKLAQREGYVAMEKLDLLSDLVRKGLDDIRKAVRIMKAEDDPRPLSLKEALLELIQYTEDTMEVKIEADICLPPDLQTGRLTERVLYHALQEGLTNSIRHGRCTFARFSLRESGNQLRFRLISDGEPFGVAVPGFGLSSMIERVELLGGEFDIRSSADERGNPSGCELTINLPL